MYAAKTAAAAAANFHHSPTSTDGSSQGSYHLCALFSCIWVLKMTTILCSDMLLDACGLDCTCSRMEFMEC